MCLRYKSTANELTCLRILLKNKDQNTLTQLKGIKTGSYTNKFPECLTA